MSWGVDRRHGSDPALLWLWCRPEATALIGPLAWGPPHATGAALNTRAHTKCFPNAQFFFNVAQSACLINQTSLVSPHKSR